MDNQFKLHEPSSHENTQSFNVENNDVKAA